MLRSAVSAGMPPLMRKFMISSSAPVICWMCWSLSSTWSGVPQAWGMAA